MHGFETRIHFHDFSIKLMDLTTKTSERTRSEHEISLMLDIKWGPQVVIFLLAKAVSMSMNKILKT